LGFLLDTNVVSEPGRKRPAPQVIAWLEANQTEAYISVLTLGEIEQGIARIAGEPARAAKYRTWLEEILKPQFARRILPVDIQVATVWGRITGQAILMGRPIGTTDALLAATAIAHDLTLVTRNTKDLEALPVELYNPWE
jgi:predicted nucleic acid-binding protein